MVNTQSKAVGKIISNITSKVSALCSGKQSKNIPEFVKIFYELVSVEEMDSIGIDNLAVSCADIFKFMLERKGHAPKMRIYNPNIKDHGWESKYTVVEIINTDTPFLVDSTTEELNRQGIEIYHLIHPVINLKRDENGKLLEIYPKNLIASDSSAESVMQFFIEHLDDNKLHKLETDLLKVLKTVRLSVEDWKSVLHRLNFVSTELSASAEVLLQDRKIKDEDAIRARLNEVREFIEWLKDNNFVFLGYIECSYEKSSKTTLVEPVKSSALGIFRMPGNELFESTKNDIAIRHHITLDNLAVIEIQKASKRSVVHRPAHMDYVAIRRFDEKGHVTGEHRFIGMFTSIVYYQSARNIPIIRKKIEYVKKESGFSPTGHSGKALMAVLEDFPRDELFQSSEKDLLETAIGIISLTIRPQVKLFIRKDESERFISCIIFVPRDRMSTNLRKEMGDILAKAFNGTISNHYTQIAESHLARIQIIIKTEPGKIPNYDFNKIEQQLTSVARLWMDDFEEELCKRKGEKDGKKILAKYKNAFSPSYISRFSAEDAYYDIKKIDKVIETNHIAFDLYESDDGLKDAFQFKVYNPENQISLSKMMPMMENMGLDTIDEHTYLVNPEGEADVWIHRFRFFVKTLKRPALNSIKNNFEDAVSKIWEHEVQDDGFNKLILAANLSWREVVLVRAYSKYLHQTGFRYSQNYIQEALGNHPDLIKLMVQLFYCRFDPNFAGDREKMSEKLNHNIEKILGMVSNLAEDRIIRALVDLIRATNRSNYFQTDKDGQYKKYVSFKFDSSKVPNLPKPRPYAEIFVYSSRVEGIHLRGGKVARGGLRWSDRREDFRTEVLGLMKAQMTKNSVIIPVGSKGGFVVKRPPAEGGREALINEGIECYKTFLRGLLDITDNLVDGKVIPPADVVRHDGDDPYLVVAADKGTATFSDIANSVAKEYNFWLGDAFASGGSVGYDHKKMAITARGAWISVERHFREMGINVSKDEFTAVGIGDMSGDVFGNGMLLSKSLKLVAAFNHLHIFIDPEPDPKASFHERKRLFDLPRSSWADYNHELISKGGGIFERSAKSIKLSKQMKDLLHVDANTMTPDELIRAILLAPVDLLWNGGIGTYVKSKIESNESVGDKANDTLRVNGDELRARVVGEGGNLGFTQLGRIEYAKQGGRLNTDAIDNSAGVDCSDHEVNIKIALGNALNKGSLSLKERDKLLEEMTDEVADLVLRDNILQTQAITTAKLQGHSILETQARLMSSLEREGLLDREVEFLPNKDEIARRHAENKGLTRPELSVLLAYSKLALYGKLLKTNLPSDEYYVNDLMCYFPEKVQEKFRKEILEHPLRKEIIATSLTNSILNRIGSTLFYHLKEDTGMEVDDIARAYTVTRDVYNLRPLWDEIETANVAVETQIDLFMEIQNLVERSSLWFLRNQPQPLKISESVSSFTSGVEELRGCLINILSPVEKKIFEDKYHSFINRGIHEKLAHKVAGLQAMSSACDIVKVALTSKLPVNVVGKVYFELGARLDLGWMRKALRNIQPHSYWDRVSIKTIIFELFDQQARLTSEVIKHLCKDKTCANTIETWIEENKKHLERYDSFISDLKSQEDPDFAMLVIAVRKVKEICSFS